MKINFTDKNQKANHPPVSAYSELVLLPKPPAANQFSLSAIRFRKFLQPCRMGGCKIFWPEFP